MRPTRKIPDGPCRRQPEFKVCLAASGGGHLRQLSELSEAWAGVAHFYVSENTALARSLESRVHFVPHYALGQGRLGQPLKMLLGAARNFLSSMAIMLRERPDVVVSTGAGSVFFSVLWGRLLGAQVVIIESFARFEGLSAFGRTAGRLAHRRIVQSERLSQFWPDALVFDPMRLVEGSGPPKEALLFATVGATLPFPRLVAMVEALARRGEIEADVIVQRGAGAPASAGLTSFETAPYDQILAILRRASIVICHGGTGSLVTALREGCHVIAVPRRFALGEHYDDHQFEIATAFADRGLIQIAESEADLLMALRGLPDRTRRMATSDYTELAACLRGDINRWRAERELP